MVDELKDQMLYCLVVGNLGSAYFYLQDYPKAIEHYDKANSTRNPQ